MNSAERVQHTVAVEEALLGCCLLSDEAIEVARRMVDIPDFLRPQHGDIFRAIIGVHSRGIVDPVTVASFDSRLNVEELNRMMGATPIISNVAEYARLMRQYAAGRRLIVAASEITMIGSEAGPDCIERAHQVLDLVPEIPVRPGGETGNVAEFLASVGTDYDWLFPDFLERQERLVITGTEGAGKSELMTQIAFMAAAGIHPWTWESVEPVRTLFVDLENNERLIGKRLRHLSTICRMDPEMLHVRSCPEGINLLSPLDRRTVFEWAVEDGAELLVIGPVYRLMHGHLLSNDIGGEQRAIEAQMVIDEWRARAHVAVILEAHSPHGGVGTRDLRPIGSSAWLRWPEFGIGLRMNNDNKNRYTVEHWRAPRDQRTWPEALTKNQSKWPWTPSMPSGGFKDLDPRMKTATF